MVAMVHAATTDWSLDEAASFARLANTSSMGDLVGKAGVDDFCLSDFSPLFAAFFASKALPAGSTDQCEPEHQWTATEARPSGSPSSCLEGRAGCELGDRADIQDYLSAIPETSDDVTVEPALLEQVKRVAEHES